jgi:hypothetical protein
MESNGVRDRIQVSEASAKLLIAAGKGHWVKAREELIAAKGKGDMQTYWVTVKGSSGKSENASTLMSSVSDLDEDEADEADETPTNAVVGANARDKKRSIEASIQ